MLFTGAHECLLCRHADAARELQERYKEVVRWLQEPPGGDSSDVRYTVGLASIPLSGLTSLCRNLTKELKGEANLDGPGAEPAHELSHAGETPADDTPIEHVQLEAGAYKILRTLASSPTRLKQDDLGACEDPSMDRKTVRRHLEALKEGSLIDYNPRDKKGAAITERGRAYLDSRPK
jgi:hypothetical protein